jgi:hypothetical protein
MDKVQTHSQGVRVSGCHTPSSDRFIFYGHIIIGLHKAQEIPVCRERGLREHCTASHDNLMGVPPMRLFTGRLLFLPGSVGRVLLLKLTRIN